MGKWEVQLTLPGDGKILYIENPERAIRKLLILINVFGSYRIKKIINTQKTLTFLYTNNKRSEREIKEIIPFTTTSKE